MAQTDVADSTEEVKLYLPSTFDDDLTKLLVTQAYQGSTSVHPNMKGYIHRQSKDGSQLINPRATWEKILLAAQCLVTVKHPESILVVSSRPFASKAVEQFASITGATAGSGHWTPGMLTNQSTGKFTEPRFIIVVNPSMDSQAIKECAIADVPVIALCNAEEKIDYVDIVIPCNNTSTESIGVIFWILAREIEMLRGNIPRDEPWTVKPDSFFHADYRRIVNVEQEVAAVEEQVDGDAGLGNSENI